MLDGDRLLVSVVGYTYCLNPATGHLMWSNFLSGMGVGVATLSSVRGGAVQNAAAADSDESQSSQAPVAS
jgi:hypothetical protein